ncbi:MAG TPA: hypothetical protein VEC38_09290 [Candidatus Binataceae bacterium]|nr:hypothetical protein [Candidatus Binataceae bacterium]
MWSIIIGLPAVLFVIGAGILVIADRPVMVAQASLAWLIAAAIPVVGYWYYPAAFDPVIDALPWLRDWLDWPPALIAGFCAMVAFGNVLYFWYEKPAPFRRSSAPIQPFRPTVLGEVVADADSAADGPVPDYADADQETLVYTVGAAAPIPGSRRHGGETTWRQMLSDANLRSALRITAAEYQLLYKASLMGKAQGPEDLRLALDAIRKVRSRQSDSTDN